MLDGAKAFEREVGAGPKPEGWLKCRAYRIECLEVTVVHAAPPRQLPDSLYGVEFGTVGRQEVQLENRLNAAPPRLVHAGVMVAGIVDDNDHFPACSPVALELFEKLQASFAIKIAAGPRCHQFAVAQTHGSKVADRLSCRGVQADRIMILGRHPHAAPRAVLLKMHFVERPHIRVMPARQRAKFFYARIATEGPLLPAADAACANESRVDETDAGTGAP